MAKETQKVTKHWTDYVYTDHPFFWTIWTCGLIVQLASSAKITAYLAPILSLSGCCICLYGLIRMWLDHRKRNKKNANQITNVSH